eukprot:gene26878-29552_t
MAPYISSISLNRFLSSALVFHSNLLPAQCSNWYPVKTLKILIKIHSNNLTGMNALDRKTSRDQYNSMTQGKDEILLNFKRRNEEALNSLRATGEPLPSEASQAVDFLSKLDEGRYAEFAWALAIINTDVTAKDLKRMVDIYGPSLGDLKGKTKRDRPSITDI